MAAQELGGGVPKVLSMMSGMLWRCATAATPSMLSTSELGLPNVSAKTTFVLGWMAASRASRSFTFTIVLLMP